MRLSRRMFLTLLGAGIGGLGVAYLARLFPFALLLGPERLTLAKGRDPPIIADVAKDAIPPLNSPRYIHADEAIWLRSRDIVLGFQWDGDARAYPFRIMNWHEIVNDRIGGRDVLVTYCPLTRSGIVFEPIVQGRPLQFGNTGALFESNLVMYDRVTESYWWQMGGRAIKGPLKDSKMSILPSLTTNWVNWRELHPETLVLSLDTGYLRPYQSDPYINYDAIGTGPAFPTSITDSRLPEKEKVVGLHVEGESKAYPLRRMGRGVIHDQVGDRRLALFVDSSAETGAVFEADLDGGQLEFVFSEGFFTDRQTGSQWDFGGRATSGPHRGERLRQIPAITCYWFAWTTVFPETKIF